MLNIFYLDGTVKETKNLDEIKGIAWVDVTDLTQEESKKLSEKFKLHPITEEDLQNTLTRIKIEEFDDYLFCVFYGILESKKIDMIEVKRTRVAIEGIQRAKKDGTKVRVFFSPSKLQIQELNLEDKKRIKSLERKNQ